MLPFGLRDSFLVSVNDVERGLQKDVICPSCKSPLVARKGKVKIHHFAHHNGDDCPAGLQTVLHMRAKEIIAERKSIFIPEYSIKRLGGRRWKAFNIITPQKVTLDDVWLEKRLDKIIPDVLAKAHDIELLIEIRVTHMVDDAKLNLIKQDNLRAIEVDLSDLYAKGYDDEALQERLLEQHDRKKWLSSPKINGVTEDVLISILHQNCSWIPWFGNINSGIVCPALGGRKIWCNDCYYCEYNYGDKGAPVTHICCGYNEKIKDYDSLQQFLKIKEVKS